MKLCRYILVSILAAVLIFSCGEGDKLITKPTGDTGSADFTRYVALGNSLTAGVQSGVMMQQFQYSSYPFLIANQVNTSFEQPLISYPGVGTGLMQLVQLEPLNIEVKLPTGQPLNIEYELPYNNLGIPGITSYDIYNAYNANSTLSAIQGGASNPLVDLVLRNQITDPGLALTPVKAAIALNPTFVTLWIGNNDALGAVVYGSTDKLVPVNQVFIPNFTATIQNLKQVEDVKIIAANIPDVSVIPYVNTIPPYILDPITNQPILDNEGNPITYLGVSPNDKVLLSAITYINQGIGIPSNLPGVNGTDIPLPESLYLTPSEIETIQDHVNSLNAAITTITSNYEIPVVDIKGLLNDIKQNGYEHAGQKYSTEFITGKLFSLDGVHPSSAGYGIVANEFIKVINQEYNADIPYIDVNSLPGVPLPSLDKSSPKKINIYELINNNPKVFDNLKEIFAY